jgi:Na+-transporting NADH:ubiquinone oxidoreductase subunit B
MKSLRRFLTHVKPHFEPGGRLHAFHSVFDGFETFLFTPNATSRTGVNIHDSLDSKRVMIIVVLSLVPCLLFGIYNVGYQHWLALGATEFPFFELFGYGVAKMFWRIVVAYVVGLGIEFAVAQWRREEIQEGFLVSGILIPMICPIETPIWMLAVATAFSVIFVKEVFGGTGYNIFNVALVTRAFLFFAYPSRMSGDSVFVAQGSAWGLGGGSVVDGFTGATPLGQVASEVGGQLAVTGVDGHALSLMDMFVGLIPGSVGETSTLCILIGGAILLLTGIASWRIMLSVFVGGAVMSTIAWLCQTPTYPVSMLNPAEQLCLGGFAFAAVFMATDPVTAAHTNVGKWVYGFLVGVLAILIRTYNNGYPEGAMLAVLLMNAMAPLIDYCVVQANINRRQRRLTTK